MSVTVRLALCVNGSYEQAVVMLPLKIPVTPTGPSYPTPKAGGSVCHKEDDSGQCDQRQKAKPAAGSPKRKRDGARRQLRSAGTPNAQGIKGSLAEVRG